MKKLLFIFSLLICCTWLSGCKDDDDAAASSELAPKLMSIIPKAAYNGASAVISGTYFSDKIEENTVEINGVKAEITAAANNRLCITLPQNPNGTYSVKVTVRGKSTEGLKIRYADAPAEPELAVLQLMPSSARYGDEIMIIGQCFSTVAAENEVTINGVKAEVKAAEANKLTIVVPVTTEGSYPVKVKVGDKEASGSMFTYLHTVTLAITSITPDSGRAGSEVVIEGENFSSVPEENVVMVGDAQAEVVAAEFARLTVKMPENAEGTYPVTVTVGGNTVEGLTFTYLGATYTVKTWVGRVRGNATNGGTCEGTAYTARFQQPDGLAFAPNGDLWFTDRGSHEIRRVTPDLFVHKVATTGAAIRSPWGAAFAPDGSFVVANKDLKNAVKIASDGSVTEFITGLNNPIGLTYDKAGNLYICDRSNNAVKKFDANGTLLASYTVTAPNVVAVDNNGRLFVGCNSGFKLLMIDTDGAVSTVFGTGVRITAATFSNGEPGDLSSATLGTPFGLVFDENGVLYISDTVSHCIRSLTPDANGDYSKGTLRTVAGVPFSTVTDPLLGDGDGSVAKFNYPAEMIMVGNTIYLSDELTWSIRTITIER